MKQSLLLFGIIAVGIIAAAELAVIYTTLSPHQAGRDTLWTFFICLYLTLSSLLTLVWQGIKRYLIYRYSKPSLTASLRQAAIFSLIIVLAMFFRSLDILSLWDIVPLFISALLIEFFFQANKSDLTPS